MRRIRQPSWQTAARCGHGLQVQEEPRRISTGTDQLTAQGDELWGSHLGRILNGELLKQEHFEIPGSRVEDVTDSEDDVAWEFWVDIGVHDDMTIAAC